MAQRVSVHTLSWPYDFRLFWCQRCIFMFRYKYAQLLERAYIFLHLLLLIFNNNLLARVGRHYNIDKNKHFCSNINVAARIA